ncbi:unnamed protein product [Alternaria sp. RS040]
MAAFAAVWMEDIVRYLDKIYSAQSRGATLYGFYKRQGDFRLLKLHPGNPGDTISTSLVTSHLSDGPSFEAMSYVWGNYSDQAQILVDGQLYCISKSLYDALHDLRHPDSVRTFWTDQVCINQMDMEERVDQVEKMGQIYKTANNVVVYLGGGTDHTETDIQHFQSFIQPYARGEEAPWSHIPIHDLGRSINSILTAPWFERMWTVQEAVLAKKTTLQWGSYQVQWAGDVRTLRALVFRIKSAVVSPVYHLQDTAKVDWTPLLYILESQMRQAARREGVVLQRNLLDIAFDHRYRKCTMPHDRYFAVLGIMEDDRGGSMCFGPNYNISVEELHQRFTAEIQRISEIEDAPLV